MSKIVQAVASMTSHGAVGPAADLNRRVQNAMVEAIIAAEIEGVTDPIVIRERQIAARDKVLAS